jgi:hypothetical protein
VAVAGRSKHNNEVAKDGAFSESLQRFRSERDLAADHVIGRNRRVAELLCYLDLMRVHNLLPANAKVSCRAAIYQDYKSSDGNQAAHYLPGQIMIKVGSQRSHDPSYSVKNARTKNAIGALFSRVQDLPADFNHADSYVEKYTRPGLKQILAEVCRDVICDHAPPCKRVSPVVRAAFQEWIARSLTAYRAAINRKTDIADLRENPVPPGTEPALVKIPNSDEFVLEPHLYKPERADVYERAVRKNRKGEVTATVWDYSQQIRILEYYLEFTEGFELPMPIVEDVESTFKP